MHAIVEAKHVKNPVGGGGKVLIFRKDKEDPAVLRAALDAAIEKYLKQGRRIDITPQPLQSRLKQGEGNRDMVLQKSEQIAPADAAASLVPRGSRLRQAAARKKGHRE
jgi:hypothetical protein